MTVTDGVLHRRLAGGCLLVVVAAAVGCEREAPPPPARLSPRAARFGILPDLVLHPRVVSQGGPFFLDRFESTEGDWLAFQRDAGDDVARGEPRSERELRSPVTRVTFVEAKAYARWRMCRLMRADEWLYAATAGNEYAYPWGNRFDRTWVNTSELGLGRLTPVGTFESGRQSSGAYDLIGNAAEWTLTVPDWFFRVDAAVAPVTARAASFALRDDPALRSFVPWPLPLATAWLVEASGRHAPRLVVGGQFGQVTPRSAASEALRSEWLEGEWSDRIGIRLATTPDELLGTWLETARPNDDLIAAVIAFTNRPEHRRVLGDAFPRALARARSPGPLASILRRELTR
jgi:formylglycine-generating enzyme required for sulfatase activity